MRLTSASFAASHVTAMARPPALPTRSAVSRTRSVHGAGLVVRAVRHADDPSSSLWIIGGIRGLVVAVAVWALAGGWLFGQTWLLVFGVVFLAEELYETGVVVLLLRMAGSGGA